MMRDKKDMKSEQTLSGVIRKEIRREGNRRLLSRMPAFKADDDVPPRFRALLGELDRSESKRKNGL